MSDNLDLLLHRSKLSRPPVESVDGADADEDENHAFGFLRGVRDRAIFIEFRFANGNRHALPYSWLGPAIYNPSAGILLKFVGDNTTLVLIEGSNLNALIGGLNLYERGILRNRVNWVREMTRQESERMGPEGLVIDRIRIAVHRSDEEPKKVEWLEKFQLPDGAD
jgi:hypothetical protein